MAILSDNTRDLEMIPSDMSDFNLYGGLYRKLHLNYLPEVSINKPKITPLVAENFKKATVTIALPLYNPTKRTVTGKATYSIFNPQGIVIKKGDFEIASNQFKERSIPVKKPMLWSPEYPNLYSIKVDWVYIQRKSNHHRKIRI